VIYSGVDDSERRRFSFRLGESARKARKKTTVVNYCYHIRYHQIKQLSLSYSFICLKRTVSVPADALI